MLNKILLGSVLLLGVAAGRVWSDIPVSVPSELLPPTELDWLRYYEQKARRGSTCCGEVAVYYAPPQEIFLGEPTCTVGGCCGRSGRGEYGIFRPGPYYVTAPRYMVLSRPCDPRLPQKPVLTIESFESLPSLSARVPISRETTGKFTQAQRRAGITAVNPSARIGK